MTLLQIAGEYGLFADALEKVYAVMKGKTGLFVNIGRSIGAIGALFYMSFRVWRHMVGGEPINFFPLLRPFVIGLCIILFPAFMDIINGFLYSILRATEVLLNTRDKSIYGISPCNQVRFWHPSTWMSCASYTILTGTVDVLVYAIRSALNILRIFFLIVLTIIGPIALGLSIFDGFQDTLTGWLKRYINIYLWLPVINILEGITYQLNIFLMSSDTEKSLLEDWVLLLAFRVALVICYAKVPEICDWIVSPSGGGGGSGFPGSLAGKIAGSPATSVKSIATKGNPLAHKTIK